MRYPMLAHRQDARMRQRLKEEDIMAQYTIEQIDYLREKATLSYEEAMELLERCDGDLTRCLVDLERRGRLKPPTRKPGARAEADANHYRHEYRYDYGERGGTGGHAPYPPHRGGPDRGPAKTFVLDMDWMKDTLFSRIVIRKDEAIIANLPVAYLIFATVVAPHLMLCSVFLMFAMGYRIKWERAKQKERARDDLHAFVDKTAQNIRRAADSFAEAVRNEVRPQPPRPEDGDVYEDEAQEAPYAQPEEAPAPPPAEPYDEEEASEFTIE